MQPITYPPINTYNALVNLVGSANRNRLCANNYRQVSNWLLAATAVAAVAGLIFGSPLFLLGLGSIALSIGFRISARSYELEEHNNINVLRGVHLSGTSVKNIPKGYVPYAVVRVQKDLQENQKSNDLGQYLISLNTSDDHYYYHEVENNKDDRDFTYNFISRDAALLGLDEKSAKRIVSQVQQ